MGEVYRATHRLLGRPAAIKLIRPEMLIGGDDDDVFLTLRRFRREAEVAAALRSPHTVQLYDFGLTADGTFYIAMELLDGLDLGNLVKRFGPVPSERAVYLLRQICSSLGEMHGHGLVHRDIKPSNVHLCHMGLQYDFVKVADLGLVKPSRGATGEHAVALASGFTLGTPAYMTPETARGKPGDTRTDVYALGCVAYWLLTGRLVFEADSGQEMLERHVRDDPSPPSHRTELEIPPSLDRLILSCLEKKPDRRPASASELCHQLMACEMTQLWTEERAERWWQAHLPNGARVAAGGA